MKLLLDMNLPPRWVQFLSDHGFECVHWSNVGVSAQTMNQRHLYAPLFASLSAVGFQWSNGDRTLPVPNSSDSIFNYDDILAK